VKEGTYTVQGATVTLAGRVVSPLYLAGKEPQAA